MPGPGSGHTHLGPAPHMVVKASLEKPSAAFPAKGYFPLMAEPFLFRRFRDLILDRDSILEFANKYGWLGETCHLIDKRGPWIGGVGLHTWQYEIQSMILAEHLWKCIQDNDRRTLRKYFLWHPKAFAVTMAIAMDAREVRAANTCTPDIGTRGVSLGLSK